MTDYFNFSFNSIDYCLESGSIPDEIAPFFNGPKPSSHTLALGSI
jgi:hypothetical protein